MNFRPIFVTLSLSKVLEMLINDWIENTYIKIPPLSTAQFGFRRKFFNSWCFCFSDRNCKTEPWWKNVVTAAFLDLSKAFDSVDHSLLLEKLKYLGFCSSAVLFIKNYLSNRHQQVVIPEAESDWLAGGQARSSKGALEHP